jgi:hypothetical protein
MEQVACFFHHPRVKSVYSPPEETGGNLFAARLFTEEAGPQTPLLCLVNPPYFSHFVVLTMGFTLPIPIIEKIELLLFRMTLV